MKPPKRSGRRGYSLMEVLIALVIVTLVTGLIFDGIGGAARLSLRLSDAADRLDRAALASDWWRASVASAMPAEGPQGPTLVGDARSLSLQTAAPLHARMGAVRSAEWRIERDGAGAKLVYAFDDQTWLVGRSKTQEARFRYAGPDRVWKDSWGERALPTLVSLEGMFAAPILAHPRTRVLPEQPAERPDEVRS